MHVLILNYHDPHANFIKKSLRYEGIGADKCDPHNLLQIWYGQYEALIVTLPNWKKPTLSKALKQHTLLGSIPTIFTCKYPATNNLRKRLQSKNIHLASPRGQLINYIKKIVQIEDPKPSQKLDEGWIKVADLALNIRTREVKRKNRIIPLRNREFTLLNCLMKNPNRVLTRTYLLEKAWDRNSDLLSNTVDVHISRLRRKIDDKSEQKVIQTIPCIGYKLVAQPSN